MAINVVSSNFDLSKEEYHPEYLRALTDAVMSACTKYIGRDIVKLICKRYMDRKDPEADKRIKVLDMKRCSTGLGLCGIKMFNGITGIYDKFYIQSPKLLIRLYSDDDRQYNIIVVKIDPSKKQQLTFMNNIRYIEDKCNAYAFSNSRKIFKRNLNYDDARDMFTENIKEDMHHNKLLNLRLTENDERIKIWKKIKGKLTKLNVNNVIDNMIKRNDYVRFLLSAYMWVSSHRCGVKFNIIQMELIDNPLIFDLDQYAFADDSE